MDGASLVSKADLVNVLKQVKDKSSDLYQDKPAPFWATASAELNLGDCDSDHRNYGNLHGDIVCSCHLCLMDVAKADTFLGEHLDATAFDRLRQQYSEDEKYDILAEFFKRYMASGEVTANNVSAALTALCTKK